MKEEEQHADPGSADKGSLHSVHSIHSISHIVEASMENIDVSEDNISGDEHSYGGDTEGTKLAAVQFKLHHTDDADSDIQSGDFDLDQSENFQIDQSKVTGTDQSEELDNDQSEDSKEVEDASESSVGISSSSYMVRSETDDFCQIHYTQTINICDVAAESIKWLSHRLGPLLTAKYLSKNLVRMLALCYLGEEQVATVTDTGKVCCHVWS